MEGLIKGLVDVAIGHHDRRHDDDDQDANSRDERSRSSWAEVVSGEKEEDHDRPERSSYVRHQKQEVRSALDAEFKPNYGNLGRAGGRSSHGRYQDQEENQEKNDDGWETVGKKKPARHPHKVPQDQWQGYKRPASEQHYSEDDQTHESLQPSQEELSDLSQACNRLWELDSNRLVPGKDYQIDCGEGKRVHQKEDMAQGSLFSWVSEDIFRKPTFARFCSLLDNYNPNEGYKEVVTTEERQEQAAFIEEISRTAVIKYLHKYLSDKGVVSESYQEFKRTLTSLWFDLYGRGGTSGSSSAFEHVFVGEIKNSGEQQVSGFHNWIQFYLEEAKGRVDYQGYIFPRRRGEIPDEETQVLTIQFEWNGVTKSVSSTLVGVSPEFELALYTLCFFVGDEDNHIQLGPYSVNVKCYRHGHRLGSAFPIADS
ncbi:PREDICTED: poly(U)-specific endoribonuclease-B [Tarenaya hassleriana]|uniref:poly(U)-specific endoribonuclease-B n=1 Tax=Tarenaya hassleriana TaxID=28532 RepID=UPI00053C63CE|nr:PREDICTED: poly(U)-specific endoribonuclease-B [Tarenaya hassleriana]